MRLKSGRLRPAKEDDAPRVLELLRAPTVRRFLCDDSVLSAADVDGLIAKSTQLEIQGLGLWVIETKQVEFAGLCGLMPVPDSLQSCPGMEDGIEPIIALHERFRGQGRAKQALSAAITHASVALHLTSLVAAVDEPNESSHALLGSCGFKSFARVQGPANKLILYEMHLGSKNADTNGR